MVDELSREVAAVAREHLEKGQYFVCSSGIRLRLKNIPPLLLQSLVEAFPDPEPPTVEVETVEGLQRVKNENDPDYLTAKEDVVRQRGNALAKLAMLYGLEADLPEDDGWLRRLALLPALKQPRDDMERQIAYMQSVALASTDDTLNAVNAALEFNGLSEAGVRQAAARFRRPVSGRKR